MQHTLTARMRTNATHAKHELIIYKTNIINLPSISAIPTGTAAEELLVRATTIRSKPSSKTTQLTKDLHISPSQSPPRPAGRPSGNTHPKSLLTPSSHVWRPNYLLLRCTLYSKAHRHTLAVITEVQDPHVWHPVSTAK
jgi:hypothetical protein